MLNYNIMHTFLEQYVNTYGAIPVINHGEQIESIKSKYIVR